MNLSPKQELRSSRLLQLGGYALLVFSALDFVQLMIPLHLMDAEWEFQFFGAVVERVALPLLGIILVFHGEHPEMSPVEASVLKGVSRLSLILAVLLLLLMPLGIFDTGRVRRGLDTKLEAQTTLADQQLARLRDLRGKITEASRAEEIARALASQNLPTNSLDFSDPEKLKTQLLSELAQTEESVSARKEAGLTETLWVLYKNSVKWNVCALIASGLFFRIWQLTRSIGTQPVGHIALLRLAGFGLLVLVAFDFVHSLLPAHPRSTVWQFFLLSTSVDRLPMLVLGLVLLFYGERNERGPVEMLLLKGLSYFSLVLGVWFLLLIPLGVVNAQFLMRGIDAEASNRLAQFRDYITKSAESSQPDSAQPSAVGSQPPKDADAGAAAKAEGAFESQVEALRSTKRLEIYKTAIKGSLAASLAVFLFFRIWHRTRWTCRPEDQGW